MDAISCICQNLFLVMGILIKQQKYVFFNIAKLQIWFLTSICCNTFLNLFYCQAYISDTSNEYNSNLSSEQGGDSTRF